MKLSDRQRKLALAGAGGVGLLVMFAARGKGAASEATYAPVGPSLADFDTAARALDYGSVSGGGGGEPQVAPGSIIDAVGSAWSLLEALGLARRPSADDTPPAAPTPPGTTTSPPPPAATPTPVVASAPAPVGWVDPVTNLFIGSAGIPVAGPSGTDVSKIDTSDPNWLMKRQKAENDKLEAEQRARDAEVEARARAAEHHQPAPSIVEMYAGAGAAESRTFWGRAARLEQGPI